MCLAEIWIINDELRDFVAGKKTPHLFASDGTLLV